MSRHGKVARRSAPRGGEVLSSIDVVRGGRYFEQRQLLLMQVRDEIAQANIADQPSGARV
jgi:hypothetical protein